MSRGSPLIGITADVLEASGGSTGRVSEPTLFLGQRYCRAIEAAGAIPLILPTSSSRTTLRRLLGSLDGLVVSGGNFDIHPSYFCEKPIRQLGAIKAQRTEFELELTTGALKRDMPILGICGGAQAINVALGGSLYQDIASQLPQAGEHQQSAKKLIGGHRVRVQNGTRLHAIVQRQNLEVNTTHHQAIKELGRNLAINAIADDGIIEGIESTKHRFVLGLQWHPEALAPRQPLQQRIFSAFAKACRTRRNA
jgi:putative glutamine amidotransferase